MQDDLVREFLWLSALKNLRVARAAGDLVEKARALGLYWARDTCADVEHKVLRELLDADRLADELEAWLSSVRQHEIEKKQDEVLAGLDSRAGRALARVDLLTNYLAYGLEPGWYGCLEPAEVRALESLSRRTGADDAVDVAGEDLVERWEAELREHLSPESALVLTRRPPGFVNGTNGRCGGDCPAPGRAAGRPPGLPQPRLDGPSTRDAKGRNRRRQAHRGTEHGLG